MYNKAHNKFNSQMKMALFAHLNIWKVHFSLDVLVSDISWDPGFTY